MRLPAALLFAALVGCSGGGSYRHEGTYEGSIGLSDYRNRGVEQLEKGRPDRAIELLTVAINLQPKDAEAYYHRGNAWLMKGLPDKAIADYGDAVRVDFHFARAWFKMGYVLLEYKAKPDEALDAFREALHVDPTYADAYLWRGLTYRALKVFNSAVADLEAAVKHGPSEGEFVERAKRELQITRQMARNVPK